MADKYLMRVTAGTSYDLKNQIEVPINSPNTLKIDGEHMDIELNVRIQNYKGLPRGSPNTSAYFTSPPHDYNKDQYSIAFRFTPKNPSGSAKKDEDEDDDDEEEEEGISAADLQFGNDFDHPIRDRLPPGFNTALNIVRWWIDPGLDGDAYADSPYLYGPALSSFNAIHVGPGEHNEDRGGLWFEEGGDEAGAKQRSEIGAPDDASSRMKWALRKESKESWVWKYGQTYGVDFFNPYLDFSDFALRLPGFTLPIMKYWDGQGLRYVLRNKTTGQVYLVILFALYLKEDVNEDGSIKPHAFEAAKKASGHVATDGADETKDSDEESFDEEKAIEEARRKLSGVAVDETSADDVD
ncbi:hypothetical protein GE09DRAFT_945876 [Coniochaeta sp. 2T2.1]|nr:hypothetical protein GE09DRAFT_945876 [Coniochaeta sp. 2T2.1]